jgi:cell division protein ZipA
LAAELRWILMGLSVPLLAGIWWWSARRAGQAPGNAALRESTAGKPAETIPPLDPRYADYYDDDDDVTPEPESRDWGVPPFEPLNIRTAAFDRVPVLDGPMMVNADREPLAVPAPAAASVQVSRTIPVMVAAATVQGAPAAAMAPASARVPATPAVDIALPSARVPATPESVTAPITPSSARVPTMPAVVTAPIAPPSVRPAPTAGPVTDNSGRFTAVASAPHVAELQKIVTIRVCAVGEARWSEAELLAALELHGLAFGRYQVFHRKHVDGSSLFCVASLIEPGTFDLAEMGDQEFRGVTLFAVLPGPIEPLDTMDELFGTARGLAEALSGMVQDAKGMPLSPQRAAALREDIARFQALLPGN